MHALTNFLFGTAHCQGAHESFLDAGGPGGGDRMLCCPDDGSGPTAHLAQPSSCYDSASSSPVSPQARMQRELLDVDYQDADGGGQTFVDRLPVRDIIDVLTCLCAL
mgnify:CR=1 FL=1